MDEKKYLVWYDYIEQYYIVPNCKESAKETVQRQIDWIEPHLIFKVVKKILATLKNMMTAR